MYLDFLISLIIFTIIYFILLYSTRFILKDLSERRYKQIRENLKIPLLLLMLNSALLIPFYYLEQTNHLLNILNHFLRISLIFLSSWFIIRLMHLIRLYLDDTHRIDASNNLKARKIHTQYRILERVFKVLIIFIAIAAALMTFDSIKKIGISLFASAGVASIIIGFSAQKIIASIIAGIQLAIAQPIRVQDVVIVNGEWGWIEEINLTYVVVKVWDRRRLVVPTTYFIDNIFQNWTRKSSFILGTVFYILIIQSL